MRQHYCKSKGLKIVVGAFLFCLVSCVDKPDYRVPIPKGLVGAQLYLGQPFSEIEEGRNISRDGLFGDYYEQIQDGPFDKVGYSVKHGRLESISLSTVKPKTEKQFEDIVDNLKDQYEGIQPSKEVKYQNKSIRLIWTLNPQVSAVLAATWEDNEPIRRYNGLFLYIGPSE